MSSIRIPKALLEMTSDVYLTIVQEDISPSVIQVHISGTDENIWVSAVVTLSPVATNVSVGITP